MNYSDFDISILPLRDGGFEAQATSLYGTPSSAFEPPFKEEEIEQLVEDIEKLIIARFSKTPKGDPPKVDLRNVGRTLYEAISPGRIREALARTLGNIEGADNDLSAEYRKGLRLRLMFRAIDYDLGSLLGIPWELICDPYTGEFLSTSRWTPIIRYLDSPHAIPPAEVPERVRMLMVDLTPPDLPDLEGGKEKEEIKKALRALKSVDVESLENPGLRELRRKMIDGRFNILHIIAHGGFRKSTGEGVIAFEGLKGKTRRVSGKQLARQLGDCRRDLRFVFITACKTGALPRRRGQSAYAGVASALVKGGVATALAMQFTVSNDAAISFSRAFYDALAHGDPIDAAVAEGRLAIIDEIPSSLEWLAPVLFMRPRNGYILQVKRDGGRPKPTEPEEVHLAVRSSGDIGAEEDPEGDNLLDLRPFFKGRYVGSPELWQDEIVPRLKDFLLEKVKAGRMNRLTLATHASITFAAGYILEAKRGLELSIIQRTLNKTRDWRERGEPAEVDHFWNFENRRPGEQTEEELRIDGFLSRQPKGGASDVAVAVSASRDVVADVEFYLDKADIPVSRILSARIQPEPGPTSVRDWDHSLRLAQQLDARMRSRSLKERTGTLHIFAAAPNVLVFHLGQLARGLGTIQLYEFDFETGKPGAYSPSIRLEPGRL